MHFEKPRIMGILNVTPDSFSDGNLWMKEFGARILQMIEDGADIIDVGGESTGPGSKDVTTEEELARVKPVVDFVAREGLTDRALFSIDTYKSEVADYALTHGFKMVNDVTALRGDVKMAEVLLKHKPYVVLMYSKDPTARTTREAVQYDDVMATVKDFLRERTEGLLATGFPREKIIVDPGMGAFVSGDPKYSFEIIERLGELKELSYPILVGVSRKSFLGGELKDRDEKSILLSVEAFRKGAAILRMHQVQGLREKLSV
jgi:dihydropteroate synthase